MRPSDNFQNIEKLPTCGFFRPVENRVKIKENKKKDKNSDHPRENKKLRNMSNNDTSCN